MSRVPSRPVVTRLPGRGDCLTLTDTDQRAWSVLAHPDGHVELHPPGGSPAIVLDEGAAAALGAFLTGEIVVAPRLAARARAALGGLAIDQVRLTPGAHAVGRSIETLGIRRRTGVTIVAVLRGSIPLITPDPAAPLHAGDVLAVLGRPGDIEALERYLQDGS